MRATPRDFRQSARPARRLSLATRAGALAVGVAAVAGCANHESSRARAADASARLGVSRARISLVFDATPAASLASVDARRGAQVAIESAPLDAWRIDARFVCEDDAGPAARESIVAVGFPESDALRVALPGFAAAGTPVVVAGAGDPCLELLPGAAILSFVTSSDAAQGAALAEFAYERLVARRMLVLFDARSERCTTLGHAFATRARGLSSTAIAVRGFSGGAIAESRDALQGAADREFDAVFLAIPAADASIVARVVREMGFRGALLGADFFETADLRDLAEIAALGEFYFATRACVSARGEPRMDEFVTRYRARFGEAPTAAAVVGFDAAMLALSALSAIPPSDRSRAAVARALDAMPPTEGLVGPREPSPGDRFPTMSTYIVRAAHGGPERVAAWRPARIPAAICPKRDIPPLTGGSDGPLE